MENKFTPELIEKAKSAKTPEELMALAKENGVELTEESAKAYFEQLNPKTGEVSDEELHNIAGGGCQIAAAGKQQGVGQRPPAGGLPDAPGNGVTGKIHQATSFAPVTIHQGL